MNILIYGASGMVGRGVLRECFHAEDVESVTVVVRSALTESHPKLRQIVKENLADVHFSQYDACFFCLGISASGRTESEYSKLTYDLTLEVATKLADTHPGMTFIYVSGAGTDSTEKGKSMWARVKGKTENSLLTLGFKSALMFRPAVIQPLYGVESKTTSYRIFYRIMTHLFPLMNYLFPKAILTTEGMGKAMLNAVRYGSKKNILEKENISMLARKSI